MSRSYHPFCGIFLTLGRKLIQFFLNNLNEERPLNILLRATCSCSCEDLNKPAPQSHWRSRLRRKDKAGISIEDLSCSTSQHLIAYNSLVNLLQDRLCNDTERPEVIYQNDVQTLLTSIVGKRTEPSYSHLFIQSCNGIKFVGNL